MPATARSVLSDLMIARNTNQKSTPNSSVGTTEKIALAQNSSGMSSG